MMRRLTALALALVLFLSLCCQIAVACDEGQTNTYVTQILFGDNAQSRTSDEKVKMLMSALYLCSEQSDGLGQDKLEYLKSKRVSGVPSLSNLNIKGDFLLECSHNTWEHVLESQKKAQRRRRKLLQNTVNKVFDFGTFNNWFGAGEGKCNSFAALLYYSHILSDYLADDPTETETNVNGKLTAAYAGQPYVTINGNRPSFSAAEKRKTESFVQFSPMDSQGRAGYAYGCIGPDTIEAVGPRQNMVGITPSGWNYNKYEGIVNSQPAYVYNRCHLLAHSLGGVDKEINLVTGTRYMNETGMLPFENSVSDYIRTTRNHVLYRATPIFKRDNKLVSGVQLEAYSVEDQGKGICFNVYCYNVQPGVDLNYVNGENTASDTLTGMEDILPFAVQNASDSNPDLIYEMNKHLEILFSDQKNSSKYISMKNEIVSLATEARALGTNASKNQAQYFIELKQLQYRYFEVLKSYVPLLLMEEEFFQSAFR